MNACEKCKGTGKVGPGKLGPKRCPDCKGTGEVKPYTWTIEIDVDPVWVADGFNPDADQWKAAILRAMLDYAHDHEVAVRVVKAPDEHRIAVEQGYEKPAKE